MRIILVVLLAYALLFSLVSLVKALISKQVKKYNLFGTKKIENPVEIIVKDKDPKRYWLMSLMHFANVIVLAFIIVKFVIS